MSGVFVAVSVGSSGSAGANVQYITRERATLAEHEHVWTENVPEYADHRAELASGISYKERVADLKEYVRQMEEDELGRRQSGNGQVRTHYRAIYSFDRPVSDEKAKQMVSEHLRESFPKARVIAAIHRDQQHPHVHAQITARDTEGRKLHFDRQTYRTLDERWAKIYGREFGQQYEREHLAKKEEWRAYMREARLAKEQGREIPQRPQRVAHERNQAQERRQMHARQYGVTRDALESTTRIAQRRAVERERSTTQQEQPAQDRVQRSGAADQRLAGPAQGREQSVEPARADDGQLRAADRAIGRETRRGHQHDGARQHQSGREDAGDGGVPERTGRDQPAAECQTQQVFKFDRASALQDERTGRDGTAQHRELAGHAGGERVARAAGDFNQRELGSHRDELGDQPDQRAERSRPTTERQLVHPDVRDDARAEGGADERDQSQATALRAGDRQQRAEHDHRQPNTAAITNSAAERHDAARTTQTQALTAADLMRQMAEVTRPTDAREAQERAVAEVAERARMEAAAKEQARQQAMEAMREQQQRQLDQERRTQALASANRTVERELYTMLKEGSDRCLSDPQTPQQLATTLERTLGEHNTNLKELGLTRERLGEQVKSYVENIRQDPEGFRQRMEPSREQQHERSLERGHDRGGFGFSR